MAVGVELLALLDRLHAAADEFADALADPYRRGVAHQRMSELVEEIDRVARAMDREEGIDLRDRSTALRGDGA
jgi:hypothetical protein